MLEFLGSKRPLITPPLTVPLQGQWERFTGTIFRLRRRYKCPICERLNAPLLRHKGAHLPTLCLLYITVPRQGQKNAFKDLNIEENFPFLNKKGACFTLKGPFLLRKRALFTEKKGHFLGVGYLGVGGGGLPPCPPPPRFRRPWLLLC